MADGSLIGNSTLLGGVRVEIGADLSKLRAAEPEAKRIAQTIERSVKVAIPVVAVDHLQTQVVRAVASAQAAVRPIVVPVVFRPVGGPGGFGGVGGVMGAGSFPQFSTPGGGGGGAFGGGPQANWQGAFAALGSGYMNGPSSPLPAPGVARRVGGPGGAGGAGGGATATGLLGRFGMTNSLNRFADQAMQTAFSPEVLAATGIAKLGTAGVAGANLALDYRAATNRGDLAGQIEATSTWENFLTSIPIAGQLGEQLANLPGGDRRANREAIAQARIDVANADQNAAARAKRIAIGSQSRLEYEVQAREMGRAESLVGKSATDVAFYGTQYKIEDFERQQEIIRRQSGAKGDTDEAKQVRHGLYTSGQRQINDAYKSDLHEREQIVADHEEKVRAITATGEQAMLRASGRNRAADLAGLKSDLKSKIKEYEDAQRALMALPSTATPNQRAAAMAAVAGAGAAIEGARTAVAAQGVGNTRQDTIDIKGFRLAGGIADLRAGRQFNEAALAEHDAETNRRYDELLRDRGGDVAGAYARSRRRERRAIVAADAFDTAQTAESLTARQTVAGLEGRGLGQSAAIAARGAGLIAEINRADPRLKDQTRATAIAELESMQQQIRHQAAAGVATAYDPGRDVIGGVSGKLETTNDLLKTIAGYLDEIRSGKTPSGATGGNAPAGSIPA